MIICTFAISILVVFALASAVSAQGYGLPSQVLSPVDGPLEVVSTLGDCSNTQWCFNQHMTGGHVAGGGICRADDSYAWDANLNTPAHDSDNDQPVYAVAAGVVAQTFGGCLNANDPGSYGQVLIEHDYQGTKWWSGYLHLTGIQVSKGQSVTEATVIGRVSHKGVKGNVNHLHFAVYTGENSRGRLQSFDVQIVPRSSGASGQGTSSSTVQDESSHEDQSGADYWANTAYDLMNQDRWEEALQALDKSIGLNSVNSEVWRNKGIILYHLGHYQEAIQVTDYAIELDPRNINAVSQRDQFVRDLEKRSRDQNIPEQTTQTAQPTSQSLAPHSGFPDGTLELYVHEVNSGMPLADAVVSVQDSFGNGRKSRTDSDGFAAFSAQPGTWQYEISKDGYSTARGTFEIIKTERKDVYLTPL